MRHADKQIFEARDDLRKLDLPYSVMEAYRSQYHNAKRRGLDFLFTLEEWWAWWQIDNRWARRGRGKGCLVMARLNDEGPYSPENVKCITAGENIEEIAEERLCSAHKQSWDARTPEQRAKWHLAVRGDAHPKAKAVIDPSGNRFGSAILAGEAHGISGAHVARCAKYKTGGWSYDPTPKPVVAKIPKIKERKRALYHGVVDPWGRRFGSTMEAATAHGYTRQRISQMCRIGYEGWHWAKDEQPRETDLEANAILSVET